MDYSFLQCGEGALTVHLGDGIDPAINRRVTALQGAIGSAGLRGITDLIPAYADLTVCYDCTVISAKALQRQLRRLLDSLSVAGGCFGCRCVTAATMGRIWILFAATAVCLRRK